MITAERGNGTNSKAYFSFKGLSTDAKPTETYLGVEIENGSSFLEMDTKSLAFYDEGTQTWV